MATKTKKAGTAAERKRPDFTGVAGVLVEAEGLELEFGANARRKSPYAALLDGLAAAGTGKLLRFDDVKARAALNSQAKKKGLRVSFAEQAGVLFVRFDGRDGDDLRAARRLRIREALGKGPRSSVQLAVLLRESGDAGADGATVAAICEQMLKAGELLKREGGGDWTLAPRKAA